MLHPDFGGDAKRVLKAQDRSQAIIGFEPNGTIIAANENFCRLVGYEPAELKGKHHGMSVDPETANSPDYKAFWAKLGRGESGLPGSPRLSLLWNATTHGGI